MTPQESTTNDAWPFCFLVRPAHRVNPYCFYTCIIYIHSTYTDIHLYVQGSPPPPLPQSLQIKEDLPRLFECWKAPLRAFKDHQADFLVSFYPELMPFPLCQRFRGNPLVRSLPGGYPGLAALCALHVQDRGGRRAGCRKPCFHAARMGCSKSSPISCGQVLCFFWCRRVILSATPK